MDSQLIARTNAAALPEQTWTQEAKLASVHPQFRSVVENILSDLRAEGYDPKVDMAWRSPDTQQLLLSRGVSKVDFSFHNAVDIDGNPAALAVDIISEKWGWSSDSFFQALGRIAKKHGAYWGGAGGGAWSGSFIDMPHVQAVPSSGHLTKLKTGGLSAIGYASRVTGLSPGQMLALYITGALLVSGTTLFLLHRYTKKR